MPHGSQSGSVSLRLEDVEDLFAGRPGDPLRGRFPVRSGFEQLCDLVEPNGEPLLVELDLTLDNDEHDVPDLRARVSRALSGYAASEIARIDLERARVRRLGLKELVFGLAFLGLCLIVSSSLTALDIGPEWLRQFLVEGLVIIGAIALWHPVDMLFFARLPLVRELRVLRRLETAALTIRVTT